MSRFKAAIAVIIIVSGLLLVGAVAPLTASAACNQAQVTLANGTGGGGARATFCFPNDVSNLSNVVGPCGVIWGSWNDCASSVRFQEGTVNTTVCLWTDSGYGGNGVIVLRDVGWFNLTSTYDNRISSIEWGTNCSTD